MDIDQQVQAPKLSVERGTFPPELKFDSDRLKIFYDSVFPYRLFFKWLSYN